MRDGDKFVHSSVHERNSAVAQPGCREVLQEHFAENEQKVHQVLCYRSKREELERALPNLFVKRKEIHHVRFKRLADRSSIQSASRRNFKKGFDWFHVCFDKINDFSVCSKKNKVQMKNEKRKKPLPPGLKSKRMSPMLLLQLSPLASSALETALQECSSVASNYRRCCLYSLKSLHRLRMNRHL